MARIEGNDLTLGLRGKFGKQFVFRKYKARTIASRKAEPTASTTDAQLEHRAKFRLAAAYARRAMLNPELKAEYEAMSRAHDNSSAFAAAVADYLKPVTITGILTQEYHGELGFPLAITVSDIFKIKTMKITLTDRDGNILDSGSAQLLPEYANYVFTTAVAVPDITGLSIKVEVTDRPGNIAVHEVTL
jgi:hypothetical protein